MADKVQLQCPACHGDVQLGDIVCPHCGMNLKSGESYETRVKQAKGKAVHPEHFAGRVGIGVAIALGLFLFAGFMWHRAVRKVMADTPETFEYPVRKLQEIDDMISQARGAQKQGSGATAQKAFNDARREMEGLIQWIADTDAAIKPEVPYARESDSRSRWTTTRKYNKRLAKRVLKNLKAKAEYRLKRIPAV